MTYLLLALSLISPSTLHVAVKGSDSNDGLAVKRAFQTISKAAEVARPGDTVLIHSGVYRESVRVATDGTAKSPITFRSAPGESVTLDGADPIGGWRSVGEGLFEANLTRPFRSVMNQDDQLFLDGQVPSYARWPNRGQDCSRPQKATLKRFISKVRDINRKMTTVVFEDDDLKALRPSDVVGSTIVVQPNHLAWSWILTGKVVALEGARITLETRSDNGQDGQPSVYAVGSRYFLIGKPWMMDKPGTWWVNRETGKVRLRLAPGDTPFKHAIELKARDFGFDLSERSHVTIQDLKLIGCSITTDGKAGGDAIPYEPNGSERFPWRPNGYVAPSQDVQLLGLDVRYPNSITDVSGHFFLQWGGNTGLVLSGTDHLVQGCHVQYADGNGISLSGRGHRCLGNTVLDSDLVAVDCAGIATGPNGMAQDIEIGYNTVDRTGRSGIVLRDWENSDARVNKARMHHNLITNYLLQDWDGGGFYVIGHDGKFARIDHNVFRLDDPKVKGLVFGLYFDYAKSYVADHNVTIGAVTAIQITREFDPNGTKVNNLLIYNNTAIPNDAPWGRPFAANINRGSLVINNIFKVNVFKNGACKVNHWPTYGSGVATGITQAENNLVYGDDPTAYYAKAENLLATDLYAANSNLGSDMRPLAGSLAATAGKAVPSVTRDGILILPFDPPKGPSYMGAFAPDEPLWPVGSDRFNIGMTLERHR